MTSSSKITRVLLSLVAPASLLAACNAISGLDQDYELASDGGSASSGSSGGGDGKGPDGSIVQNDGDVTPDGDRPDAPSGDCNGASVPGAVFCWNFDSANPLAGGWNKETVTPSAVLDLAPAGVTGNGLHAHVNGNTGSTAKADLVRNIPTPDWTSGKTLTLKFQLKVTSAGTDYAAFGVFEFGSVEDPTPTDHGLAFYGATDQCLNNVAPCLDETEPTHRPNHNADTAGSIPLTPLLNQWMPVEVSITRQGNAFAGKVKVNNLTLDDRQTNAMPTSMSPPSAVALRMGVFFAGAVSGATDVIIDDIIVTFK